jgi:hypothetical protein
VRRGLKILKEAKAVSLETYMVYVNDFYEKYFLKHPKVSIKNFTKNIYLVTEDLDILKEALTKYFDHLCDFFEKPKYL